MPHAISANQCNTYGRLAKYANPEKRQLEEAYERAIVEKKYKNAD